MQFILVDTLSAYQRLLAAPDAPTRERIFLDELVQPFRGLVNVFGGDGLAAFAGWGMSPDAFAGADRAGMETMVERLRQADAQNRAMQALEKGRAVFERHINPIPLDKIIFGLYVADMRNAPGNPGYTGFGGIPGWIMTVYGEATDYTLARVEAATVHELHHNVMGAVGQVKNSASGDWNTTIMNTTVGDYMVGEGLAESFAAELYGDTMVGPWVSAFDDTQLPQAKRIYKDAIRLTGFANIQRYLYRGDEFGLHPTTGYALGYRIVQAYLRQSGKSVVEASLVSPGEVLMRSGFFDDTEP